MILFNVDVTNLSFPRRRVIQFWQRGFPLRGNDKLSGHHSSS